MFNSRKPTESPQQVDPTEAYRQYQANCLLISPEETVPTVMANLQKMEMHDHIVIPPFSDLEQIISILTQIGDDYEICLEVVVPTNEMCDCTAILCKNSEGLKMKIIQPIPGRHHAVDHDYVREYDYSDSTVIEDLLRKVGMISHPEKASVVVITKGDKNMTGRTVETAYFDCHSHPSDSTTKASYSDKGGTSKRYNDYTDQMVATPGITPSRKSKWELLSRLFGR